MLPFRITPYTVVLVILLSVAVAGHAQRTRAPKQIGSTVVTAQTPEAKRRVETFHKVWQTLNEHYFDRNFNNLNWTAVKAEYEPKVKAAKTDAVLHRLLYEMISRLGSSHLTIIPPEVYQEIERAKTAAKVRLDARKERLAAAKSAGSEDEEEEFADFDNPLSQYGIGVDLRIIGGQFVVTRVDKNSAAEYAGLKTGFVIEKINELLLPDLLMRLSIYYAGSRGLMNQIPSEIVSEFINGEKDSTINLTYLDEADTRKQISIRRELLRGQMVTIGKGFPEKHLEFEAHSLTPEIGYVRFDQFAMPVVEKFCDAVGKFRGTKGIIIDLRGNGGGIIAAAIGLSGMLSETTVDMGTSSYKWSEQKLTASPKLKNYKGRLVFLIDETTASAAEMFAVSFQDSGRGFVVGDRSAGATLPSVVIDLPTGAVMQYPVANYRSSKGVVLEGKGITPNYPVSLDRKTLTKGIDPQLEKARSVILDDKAFASIEKPKALGGPASGTGLAAVSPPPDFSGPTGFAAAPPPPPPAKGPPPPMKVRAEVNVKLPPPAAVKPAAKRRDPEAVRIINEFVQISGGREALAKLDTYELAGKARMTVNGAVHDFEYGAFKKSSDKYSEVMSAPGIGEIREVYNGRTHLTQTDFGLAKETPLPEVIDVSKAGILGYMRMFTEDNGLLSLKYGGTYTRDGRKVHLIDAESELGSVAFAFDVENKTLTYFTGPAYGVILTDYRKVGDLTLPFGIERETLMKLQFDSVKINQPIDDSRFVKKINCYDVPN